MISFPLATTLLTASLVGLAAAAARDIRDRIIPNGLVIFVACIGLLLRLAAGVTSMWFSLMGSGFVFIVLVFLAHRNFIGGGDAKLIAAAALLVPPNQIISLLLDIALAGGLLACFYLVLIFIAKKARWPIKDPAHPPLDKKGDTAKAGEPILYASLPYALAILCGVAACLFSEVLQCFNATSCSL